MFQPSICRHPGFAIRPGFPVPSLGTGVIESTPVQPLIPHAFGSSPVHRVPDLEISCGTTGPVGQVRVPTSSCDVYRPGQQHNTRHQAGRGISHGARNDRRRHLFFTVSGRFRATGRIHPGRPPAIVARRRREHRGYQPGVAGPADDGQPVVHCDRCLGPTSGPAPVPERKRRPHRFIAGTGRRGDLQGWPVVWAHLRTSCPTAPTARGQHQTSSHSLWQNWPRWGSARLWRRPAFPPARTSTWTTPALFFGPIPEAWPPETGIRSLNSPRRAAHAPPCRRTRPARPRCRANRCPASQLHAEAKQCPRVHPGQGHRHGHRVRGRCRHRRRRPALHGQGPPALVNWVCLVRTCPPVDTGDADGNR